MKTEQRVLENLARLRSRMGLTVAQFAKAVGIPEGTLKDRQRNPGTFRLSEIWRLEKIAQHYGLTIQGGGETDV